MFFTDSAPSFPQNTIQIPPGLWIYPESGKGKTTWFSICSWWYLLRWTIPSVSCSISWDTLAIAPHWYLPEPDNQARFETISALHDSWQFLLKLPCLSQGKRKYNCFLIIFWWHGTLCRTISPICIQGLLYVQSILLPDCGEEAHLQVWHYQGSNGSCLWVSSSFKFTPTHLGSSFFVSFLWN